MTTELHTNDEPQRILLEASERIKACYPPGTSVEALIDGNTMRGHINYDGFGKSSAFDETRRVWLRFYPAIHPHRVLP